VGAALLKNSRRCALRAPMGSAPPAKPSAPPSPHGRMD
jgi:hypothetical protein